jgi:hypothetical protein
VQTGILGILRIVDVSHQLAKRLLHQILNSQSVSAEKSLMSGAIVVISNVTIKEMLALVEMTTNGISEKLNQSLINMTQVSLKDNG